MKAQMIRTTSALLALCVVGLGMVACGSGNEEAAAEADRTKATTFGAYAATWAASAPPSMRALSDADRAEIAQRSREWASAAITAAAIGPTDNVMTAPGLYFARLQLVYSAAAGDTLSQLQTDLNLPTRPVVWAGLMQGVLRGISAAPETVVTGTFMQAATLVDHPGRLAALSLNEVSAAALALEPSLRLEVSDSLSGQNWSWPSAGKFTAPYTDAAGRRSLLTLVRVQGAVSSVDGAGYLAKTLALPGQARLVRITPLDPINTWNAARLSAAVAETAALAPPAEAGELVLLDGTQGAGVGMDDERGLSLAMNSVDANFQGLDGTGGTYLRLGSISASAFVDDKELRLGGNQGLQFIYSPLDRNGGGVVVIETPDPQDCSAAAADIAPYFLALLRDDGSVAFLARMATLQGAPCGFVLGTL